MKFTTKTAEAPTEFKAKFYFVDGDDSSGIELRLLTDEDKEEARGKFYKEATEYAVHPDTKVLTRVDAGGFDFTGLTDWYAGKMIHDWWGISIDEEEFACNAQNKLDLYAGFKIVKGEKVFIDKDNVFYAFVQKCYTQLQKDAKKSFGSTGKAKN